MAISWGTGERPTEGYNNEEKEAERDTGSEDKEDLSDWAGNTPTTAPTYSQEDWLAGSAGDEIYQQEGVAQTLEQEISNLEEELDATDDPDKLRKIASGIGTVLGGTVVGSGINALTNLFQSDEQELASLSADEIKTRLKRQIKEKEISLKQVEERISELDNRIKTQSGSTGTKENINNTVENDIKFFKDTQRRDHSPEETLAIVNKAIDKNDPVIPRN